MLKGILLDLDGTLLASNEAHAHAWVEAYRDYGYDISYDTIYPLIGMGGDKLMAKVTPGLTSHEGKGKEIDNRRREIVLQKYAPHLKPTPGARDLVEKIKASGVTPVIATSSGQQVLEVLLKAAGVADLIQHETTNDDAEQSKPSPDIVQAALQRGHLDPADALMIGDTPYDVESGNRAGVGVIGVRTGGHDADLKGALDIYDSPADIVKNWDTSPIVERLKAGSRS